MHVSLVEKDQRSFLRGMPGEPLLTQEQDIVGLIGLCGERYTDRVLLFSENLPSRFLDLSSGVAGMMLQKFVNYRIKVAAVLPQSSIAGKFSEFVFETNRGTRFRVFHNPEQAERWLLAD